MTAQTATLPDGSRVVIRQLRPDDGALYPDFLSDVTPEDLRLRFFARTAGLSDALISRLTRFDPATAMAFIALTESGDRMLGVVRLHDDPGGRTAEYAVLVRSSLKGRGLGWTLMNRMIDYAKEHGTSRIHGQVLAGNTTMLKMCAELGFDIADDPGEPGIKYVTLNLGGVAAPG